MPGDVGIVVTFVSLQPPTNTHRSFLRLVGDGITVFLGIPVVGDGRIMQMELAIIDVALIYCCILSSRSKGVWPFRRTRALIWRIYRKISSYVWLLLT